MSASVVTDAAEEHYNGCVRDIERRVTRGVSFWDLETYIDELPGPLTDDQRAALWLLALGTENTPDTRAMRAFVNGV